MKPIFDHFGRLAPVYEFFIHPAAPEKLLELAQLPQDALLLDAGGGTGRVSQFFQARVRQIVVADVSFKMLLEAHKKDRLQPLATPLEHLPFKDDLFDRIIMVDALHHMESQQKTAAELWRVLKPQGLLIIEEPDIRFFRVKLIALGEKLALMRSHFLSPAQIAGLFQGLHAQVQIEHGDGLAWILIKK